MAAVMGELGYIEMRGYNDFNKYKYAKAADIAAACAKAMAKHGVAFSATEESVDWPEPRTSAKGGTLYLCRARVKFTFFDTESDEKIEVVRTGQATDSGDKDIFKAFTGALKYALVQTFLIATGDDPEDDADEKKTGGSAEPKGKVELKPDPPKIKAPPVPANTEQIKELLNLCEQTETDPDKVPPAFDCSWDTMTVEVYEKVKAILLKRVQKRAENAATNN